MKNPSDIENKAIVPELPVRSSPRMVSIKIKPGRAVHEGQPGDVVQVTEARADYLVGIGYADRLEDKA